MTTNKKHVPATTTSMTSDLLASLDDIKKLPTTTRHRQGNQDTLSSSLKELETSLSSSIHHSTKTTIHPTTDSLLTFKDLQTSLSYAHQQQQQQPLAMQSSILHTGQELSRAPQDLLNALPSQSATQLPLFLTTSTLEDNHAKLMPLQLRLSAISESAAILHGRTMQDMVDSRGVLRKSKGKKRESQRAHAASKAGQRRGNQRRFEPY